MELLPFAGLIAISVRSLGLLTLLPIPWDLLGVGQRMLLSVGLGFFFAPMLSFQPHITLAVIGIEFAIGLVMALPAALVVESAAMLGELYDAARGQTIAQAYDPGQQNTVPITANLMNHLVWALLVSSGFLLSITKNFADSLILFTPGTQPLALSDLGQRLLTLIASALQGAFVTIIPILAIFLVIEVGLGFISRGLNGVALSTEGFTLKILIGTIVLVALNSPDLGITLERIAARPILALVVK